MSEAQSPNRATARGRAGSPRQGRGRGAQRRTLPLPDVGCGGGQRQDRERMQCSLAGFDRVEFLCRKVKLKTKVEKTLRLLKANIKNT